MVTSFPIGIGGVIMTFVTSFLKMNYVTLINTIKFHYKEFQHIKKKTVTKYCQIAAIISIQQTYKIKYLLYNKYFLNAIKIYVNRCSKNRHYFYSF